MSGRYPYTYAADFVRENGPAQISRSDASQLISRVAAAVGLAGAELSAILAAAYQRQNGMTVTKVSETFPLEGDLLNKIRDSIGYMSRPVSW